MAKKQDLVESLSNKLEYLSHEDALYATNIILGYMEDQLAANNRIEIRGFGSLSLRKRKYSGKDKHYNSVYYRMAKEVKDSLK